MPSNNWLVNWSALRWIHEQKGSVSDATEDNQKADQITRGKYLKESCRNWLLSLSTKGSQTIYWLNGRQPKKWLLGQPQNWKDTSFTKQNSFRVEWLFDSSVLEDELHQKSNQIHRFRIKRLNRILINDL